MKYIIIGTFNTGDNFKDVAHNKSELEFLLHNINMNQTIYKYDVYNSKDVNLSEKWRKEQENEEDCFY